MTSGLNPWVLKSSHRRLSLQDARLFLETSLLRYATEHATNAQIGKMIEAIDACELSLDDVEAFRDADVQFHRALSEIPGNPIFVALHDTFVDGLMKNRALLPDFEKRNAVWGDALGRGTITA